MIYLAATQQTDIINTTIPYTPPSRTNKQSSLVPIIVGVVAGLVVVVVIITLLMRRNKKNQNSLATPAGRTPNDTPIPPPADSSEELAVRQPPRQ